MNPFFLRVLLTADPAHPAVSLEQFLCEAGHEVVMVEARGDAALKAARLLHPDLIILTGPLRGTLTDVALAAAIQTPGAAPVPVILVTDPAQLPGLLALQAPARPVDTAQAAPI